MATKLGTLTLDLVAKIGNFTQGMRQASSSAEREMQRASSSVNVMNGMLGKLAATAGAAFSINQVKNYADSYTGMVNKLKLVTSTQSELSRAMDDTHKIAQATASDWNGVLDVYTKFQGLSKRLGIDQAEVARITETVTKTVSMSGQSAAASEAALLQFGQALNTGVLRGAELVSVMSQAPALAKALADGMGVAVGDLKKLGEEGKITSEVMRDALLKMSSSVDAEYAKTATTVSASFNLITTEATKLIGEFDQAHGVSKTFVEGMTLVAENIGNITKVMMVAGAYMAGKYIALLTATAIGYVRNTVEVVRYQMALAGMQANAVGAARSLVLLRTASSAALGVLLSPVGLGVAVASVAAGYLLMKGNADKATASIDTQGQSVDDLIEKYRELNTLQRDNETRALAQQVEDLSLKYRVAASDLFAFMEGLPIADEKINTFKKLNSELSQGRISSNEYYEAVKEVNVLTDDQLAKVGKLIGAYSDNKKELKAAEQAQDALEKSMKKTTKEAKEQAAGVGELSEAIKKLLKESNQTIKDSAITSALANRGYNDTMIELAKKYLNVEGAIVKNEQGRLSLRADLQKMFTTEYNEVMRAKNATDARNEAEKKITQEKEKQAKLTKASTIDAVISSGEGNYNSVNLGQKGGYKASTRNLTDMTVAQILSAQRAKEFNAAGKYQTINSTLQEAVDKGVVSSAEKFTAEVQERIFKQYLVAIKRPEIKGFITGSNKATLNDALLGSAKEFASVANPSTGKSYYAGQGNNKASISAEKMTESLLAQQKVYRENIALGMDSEQAWLKSFNASTTVVKTEEVDLDKFLEDMIKRKQEQADEQKAIQVSYYNEWQNLEYDNQERIKEIEKAFATDPTERDRLLGLQQKAYEDDVANWIKAQDERVKAENEANQQILTDRYKFLNDSVAIYDRIAGLSSGADEIFARATMSPEGYGQWSLANDRSNSQAALKKERVGVEQDIMTSNLYSTDDERYEALKEAHQQYRDGLAAIDVKYYQGLEDLQNQTQAASLAGYGAMFGMMGSMLDAYGAKESTAYKVAFAMQKGFVLSSAILNAKGAIMSAWNDPSNVTMWQKIAGAAAVAVQTNDLMSAIQGVALTGMAHDGIDNIPKEGTWLLDKGERVVDSRTNADLKEYLAKGGGSGGDVYYTQTIHIASDGSATSESDAKQLGKMMENMTLSVIRREQRQGGLLAR